ncbi:MAG: glycosyltransferase, partial [Prevotella sp.]|nr:glycosyltransferase [Prevotella sp.]
MRVLIANKFYYPRGGDCIYALNTELLLRAHGDEVAVFAMQHPENLDTAWSRYFPKEVRFDTYKGRVDALMRPFGTRDVRRRFNALLDDFKPDVVHLNNIHSQLSPLIAELAHGRSIRVVWTVHDCKLLCPRYDCLRRGESVCEACFGDKRNVLRYRCMKRSLPASIIAYLEAVKWSRARLETITDKFICPSRFMAEKMRLGGYDAGKLTVLPNFINTDKCAGEDYRRGDYFCYVGRLSDEKGVRTLIAAANRLPYKLIVAGTGPLAGELKLTAHSNIEFAGFKGWNELREIVGGARFCV